MEESKKYFGDGERRAGHAPLRPTRTPHGLLPLRRGGPPPLRRDWSLIKNRKKQEHQDTTRPALLPFPSVPGGRKQTCLRATAYSIAQPRPIPALSRSVAVLPFFFYGPAESLSKPSRRAPRRMRRAERDHRITQPCTLLTGRSQCRALQNSTGPACTRRAYWWHSTHLELIASTRNVFRPLRFC